MTRDELTTSLSTLVDQTLTRILFQDESLQMDFSDGTTVWATYWRILEHEKPNLSSFDHNQQYGLPKPIDAVEQLCQRLRNEKVQNAVVVKNSGDIELIFENRTKLQIFNFSGYEVWEVEFADGTGQYSNYV